MNKPTAKPQPDFPVWLPPALVKELRQGLRMPAFMVLLSLFPTVLAFIFLLSFIMGPTGSPLIPPSTCNGFFWGALLLALLMIIPLRGVGSVQEELQSRNNELLILTRQSSTAIILGKWLSIMAQALLILFMALPFMLIRYYYGQINPLQDLTTVFLAYTGCGILSALCLWFAGMPKLLRLLLNLGLVPAVIISIAFVTDGPDINLFYDGFWQGILIIGLIVIDAWAIIRILLTVAQRSFSPAAENTFAPARKTALITWLAALIPLCIMTPTWSSMYHVAIAQSLVAAGLSALISYIDMTTPVSLLGIHWEQMRTKKCAPLQRLFFLPGQPPAFAFSLLNTVLTIASIAYVTETLNPSDDNWRIAISIFLELWYILTIVPLFLHLAWKKLKNMTMPVALIITAVILFIVGIFTAKKIILPILPGSALTGSMGNGFSHDTIYPVYTFINVLFAFIVLYLTNADWFEARRKYAKLAKNNAVKED